MTEKQFKSIKNQLTYMKDVDIYCLRKFKLWEIIRVEDSKDFKDYVKNKKGVKISEQRKK